MSKRADVPEVALVSVAKGDEPLGAGVLRNAEGWGCQREGNQASCDGFQTLTTMS